MELPPAAGPSASVASKPEAPVAAASDECGQAVAALYRQHALGLIRLAYVMLGDRAAAEDVVQEAFCGLYRRWQYLSDSANALPYLRSCVLNGCRSVLRSTARDRPATQLHQVPSAESIVLTREQCREVVAALRRLPDRQREALVLRFYLGLSDAQIASDMGVSKGTVRSTTYRALAALGIALKESP
jgi:RNA polymerase sigma-70 factor (sigma-E family)